MSAPTLIRRELKNARIYFVPAGETVNTVTVASTTWPTGSLSNYEFADIEGVKSEKQIKTDSFMVPSTSGGYYEDSEEMVTKRSWKATTSKTNSFIKKLEHSLATIPVTATAQTVGITADNFIDGLMKLELTNKNGVVIETTQVWARLRLVSAGDVGQTTSKIEISFELRPSSLNTITITAG